MQYVAALEKKTGRLAWKAKRTGAHAQNPDFRKAYTTPLVIRVGGKDHCRSEHVGALLVAIPDRRERVEVTLGGRRMTGPGVR